MENRITNITTDILVVGGGPAGLTAGLYGARSGKKTLVLEGKSSRLSIGYELENYPGFISIDSRDLLNKFRDHARHFGAEFLKGDALDFSLASDPKFVTTRDTLIQARAVILASGRPISKARLIPGEERLLGMGVSYCGTCDGPLYRNRMVIAVGNTDEAAEDVLALDQMGCNVSWMSGDDADWQVKEELLAEVRRTKVTLYPKTRVREILGEQRVEKVRADISGETREFEPAGVFVFRDIPTASFFSKSGLELDHRQCVSVDRFQRTNLEGVFGAGDITCGGMQVISAAGEGCVAAMRAISYLRKIG